MEDVVIDSYSTAPVDVVMLLWSKSKLSPSFVEAEVAASVAEVAASVQEQTTLQEILQCSAAFSHSSLVSYEGDREQQDTGNSTSFNIYIWTAVRSKRKQWDSQSVQLCPASEYNELVIASEASVRMRSV